MSSTCCFDDVKMNRLLHLKHLQPVAIGRQRYVFVHPDDPGLIVKVVTEAYVARRSDKGGRPYKRWHKNYIRARHHQVFQREINEQLALRAAEGTLPQYLQEIVGFAETDVGMGVVSRSVRDRRGNLAPTLRTLLEAGRFDDSARRHLDDFFDWLLRSVVVIGDLNAGNLVYGYDDAHGDHFVVIDGIGDKNIIPLSSISMRLNRMSKERRIQRINEEIARHVPALAVPVAASPRTAPRRPLAEAAE
jgi:hypothetical protein